MSYQGLSGICAAQANELQKLHAEVASLRDRAARAESAVALLDGFEAGVEMMREAAFRVATNLRDSRDQISMKARVTSAEIAAGIKAVKVIP